MDDGARIACACFCGIGVDAGIGIGICECRCGIVGFEIRSIDVGKANAVDDRAEKNDQEDNDQGEKNTGEAEEFEVHFE